MALSGSVESVVSPQKDNPKGVRGWLLVLCIILAIVGPSVIVYSIVAGWRITSPLFEKMPGLEGLIVLDAVFNIALAAWSLYAGISLWMAKPEADKTAKGFLIGLPILRALIFAIVIFSDVRGLGIGAFMGLVQSLIFSAIWRSYLTRSKRVQATFAQAPASFSENELKLGD